MNINIKTDRDFENTLQDLNHKYGEAFEILNGFHDTQLNFSDFINGFVDKNEVTIDANANAAASKDIVALQTEKTKSHDKLFGFSKIFYEIRKKYGLKTAKEWLEAEYNGAFYMHDAVSASFKPYCYAYDLSRLAREGLFFFNDYNNEPPRHLTTFFDDVIEFISFMCNRSAGAVGLPNILVWSFYFWKKDCESGYYIKDPDYYIRQNFQKLIFRLNQPYLKSGTECSFTNCSIFDREYAESLFGGLEYPDGTYFIDYIDEFLEHEKVFMEVVSDTRSIAVFGFPVLTYSLLYRDGKFVDEEFARWCSDHNTKWNDANFFISGDVNTLSNCCRLLADCSQLSGFINSIGGTALSIGSVKVNTINLMRIALEAKKKEDNGELPDGVTAEDEYFNILRKRTNLCCKVLNVQRHIIQRNIEKGLLPNFCDGGIDMEHMYSTIGILACEETVEFFGGIETDEFGNVGYNEKGMAFACRVFDVINDVKDNFDCNFSFNIESVPGERAACILCQKDNALFGLDTDRFIYSNQWIPLSAKCTIAEKLRTAAVLDNKCSGGAIAHINLEANFPNTDMAWDMLNKIAQSGVIYFAFNTRINECTNHHGFVGGTHCPICGSPINDTYQRIVGYLVPTRNYSKDRFKEFTTRKWFNYAEMLNE